MSSLDIFLMIALAIALLSLIVVSIWLLPSYGTVPQVKFDSVCLHCFLCGRGPTVIPIQSRDCMPGPACEDCRDIVHP